VVSRVDLAGGFLQSVWNHTYSTRSDMSLLFSYDTYERGDLLNEGRRTFNLEFQNHIGWGSRQDIVWGAGYRYSDSQSDGSLSVSLNPANIRTHLFSTFVQDEISLLPDRVSLTLGTTSAIHPLRTRHCGPLCPRLYVLRLRPTRRCG